MKCRVCGSETSSTHTALILGQIEAAYHICHACDFWCTDEPTWLEQAYGTAISALDTGAAQRNLEMRRRLALPLLVLARRGAVVDWAGGSGLLTRLLRDLGLDCYWQDLYAENVYARGFEWQAGQPCSVVTAVEVLEHVADPVAFLRDVADQTRTDSIIFTQPLHPGPDPDWWYLVPETGQHVSFYSGRTLVTLAGRLGMKLHTAGDIHVLTKRTLPSRALSLLTRLSPAVLPVLKSEQTWRDHVRLRDALARRD